jgi:hypothetical protein
MRRLGLVALTAVAVALGTAVLSFYGAGAVASLI